MLEVDQLTYSAIITINLPGTENPATASITLMPQDAIPTGSGEVKLLRDCTLADLNEFADTLEAEVWAAHQERLLTDLAGDEMAHVKITILNETGRPLSTTAEDWLAHAVIFPEPAGEPAFEVEMVETVEIPAGDATDVTEEAEVESLHDTAAISGEAEEADLPVDEPPAGVDDAESAEAGTTLETEAEPAEITATDMAPPQAEEEAPASAADEDTPDTEAPPAGPTKEVAPGAEPPTAPPEQLEMRIAGLRRPLGHPTPAAVDILINEPVFRDAQAHALSSLDREVAGVLVGPMPEKQPDGRYVVHITDMIIAKHTKMHGASVTYTPESWRHIHDRLGERYPNEEALIVGWYHTHPGFGIFLSGMDLFIHQNFFTQLWHVALVLDPVARSSGFFCWTRGQTEVKRYEFPWPKWLADSW